MADRDNLVDMHLSGADRGTVGVPSIEQPAYSYGLVLRLENPELKKLQIKRLPQVGDEYEITAVGKITNVYESQSEGNREDKAVQIQITHLKIK